MHKFLVIILLLGAPARFWAQADRDAESNTVDEVLHTLAAVRSYYEVAISPDGTRLAWVENRTGEGVHGTSILVAGPSDFSQARRITATDNGSAYEDQIAWSPDGTQLAFLSDAAQSGQQQLYVADIESGKARRLTGYTGHVSTPAWSPDGKSIAVLVIENSPRSVGPLQPTPPPSGVVEEKIDEQGIQVVGVSTGNTRAVSPADLYVYEYDWAPDNAGFVVTAAHGDGDNNWWTAQLYRLSLDGQLRLICTPASQIANPRMAPDGKTVAFIGGLMSDQGVVGGDVYVVPGSGGEARDLTVAMNASATWLTWVRSGKLLFTALADGDSAVETVDTDGKVSPLWKGPELISSGSWAVSLSPDRDGRQTAVVRSSAMHPPEVWMGPVGAWQPVTRANQEVKPMWGEARSVHWKNDGFSVQGWMLTPRDFKSGEKYPLIVHVHGGPASACSAGWPAAPIAAYAAAGYFVLCPNPRGSYGEGEAFTRANVKDFGGGDFRDLMIGVDEALRRFPVDGRRVGLWGWSYGGYMAMWAETQTQRFAAVVAGAGIANWLSYYGENHIDQWMIPYFGASVYDDPAVYARSGPIQFVKNVKAPTLILVGDRDAECPAPQSFEWWHALKTLNVPVEFVVYPGEGHMIQQMQHRRDLLLRSVQWFDRWLAPSGEQPAAGKKQ
jgi:dipeptidyl aminopeptidase/acylaminoacyl peptidase